MYAIEPRITVKVESGRSSRWVDVTVPWNVLRFLDQHSERRLTADGEVVYRLARTADLNPRELAASRFETRIAA